MMGTPMADASAANVAGNETSNPQPHWLDRAAGRAYALSMLPWIAGFSAARTVVHAVKTVRPSDRAEGIYEYCRICEKAGMLSFEKLVKVGLIRSFIPAAYSRDELREVLEDANRFSEAIAQMFDTEPPPALFGDVLDVEDLINKVHGQEQTELN